MNDLELELLDVPLSNGLPNVPNSLPAGELFVETRREKFVAFYFGESLYGAPAAAVAELVQPLPVTPLPNAPEILSGIAVLRGELLAILNLRDVFSSDTRNRDAKSKFVILHPTGAQTPIAFCVDRMHEIVFLSENELQLAAEKRTPHLTGSVATESGHLNIIDTGSLSELLTSQLI